MQILVMKLSHPLRNFCRNNSVNEVCISQNRFYRQANKLCCFSKYSPNFDLDFCQGQTWPIVATISGMKTCQFKHGYRLKCLFHRQIGLNFRNCNFTKSRGPIKPLECNLTAYRRMAIFCSSAVKPQ